MRKCSPLFHLLNSLTCCNGSLNRTALRISRGLCEASNALPSQRERCDHNQCDKNDNCGQRCRKDRLGNHHR